MWTRTSDIDRMFGAMSMLRRRMNNVLNDFDRSYDDYTVKAYSGPRINLYDSGEALRVIAEVPGVSREDLRIRIQGNYLELSGGRRVEPPEGHRVHRSERPAVTFTRSLTLPVEVDSERAEAVLRDGILTLDMPKIEAAKPRQISIR
ncbi:MAG: Hsp20/alpha crystallin family protein [Desulfopila sp.]